jgi:hypothetical protein
VKARVRPMRWRAAPQRLDDERSAEKVEDLGPGGWYNHRRAL